MNHWIFDFDGVLARTLEGEIPIQRKIRQLDWSDDQIRKRIIEYFSTTELSRKDNVTPELIEYKKKFIKKYTELVLESENQIFHEFIHTFTQIQPSKFAVVSSGGEQYITKILEQYKDRFEYIYGMETHHSKEEKVEMVAQNWKVGITQVKYFTDTISDVLELKDLIGLENIYGCAWGWCGAENLAKVLPKEHIFFDYQDILKI